MPHGPINPHPDTEKAWLEPVALGSFFLPLERWCADRPTVRPKRSGATGGDGSDAGQGGAGGRDGPVQRTGDGERPSGVAGQAGANGSGPLTQTRRKQRGKADGGTDGEAATVTADGAGAQAGKDDGGMARRRSKRGGSSGGGSDGGAPKDVRGNPAAPQPSSDGLYGLAVVASRVRPVWGLAGTMVRRQLFAWAHCGCVGMG